MTSKHFSNDAAALVAASLRAATLTNPSVVLDAAHKIVALRDAATQPTVAILSGGGSGHEPSFGGFVGQGFLTAAVAGSIFASPSAEQVFQGLLRLGQRQPSRGILVVIMNYTGDKLHFGMAAEKARAAGIRTELLVVGDDVGVGRKRSGRIGRRGLAGTVLVQKLAAAAAAQGASLDEVLRVATLASENVATAGASLAHVHVPGRDVAPDQLGDETEIGMGIHNEEGFARVQTSLPGVVGTMLRQLLDQSDADRAFVRVDPGDDVVVMVNNLGAISALELGAITAEVCLQLRDTYRIRPVRLLSGAYMTSLNGLGFSITLLKAVDARFVALLDAPADASGWIPPVRAHNWQRPADSGLVEADARPSQDESASSTLSIDAALATQKLQRALRNVVAAEAAITQYDTIVGDGDCGLCLQTGAEAVLAHLAASPPPADAVRLVRDVAHVVEQSMDGTSGALYAIFLNALAAGLLAVAAESPPQPATAPVWAAGLRAALASLAKYTPAQPGDRTVVDALAPFVATLGETANLALAAAAARRGCDATQGMTPSLGRATYVNAQGWSACPDPGAFGLVKLLEGLAE